MPQISGYNVRWCGKHIKFESTLCVSKTTVEVETPPTLIDVPFDTLMVYLLPFLDVKHIGILSMAHPILNQFCSQNTVWAAVYGRKIVDTSVHIGGCLNAQCMPADLYSSLGKYRLGQLEFIRVEAKKGRIEFNCLEASKWNGGGCRFCSGGGSILLNRPGKILAKWSSVNGQSGLSTTNLCQCLDHYQVETLEFESPRVKSKNFKNLVKNQYNVRCPVASGTSNRWYC